MIALNLRLKYFTAFLRSGPTRLQRPIALLLAATIALGLLLSPASAALADTGLKLEVKPGLEGIARHGSWLPVTVKATNSGADFAGTVVLRLFSEGSPDATEWRRDFAVGAGEEAEAIFYVPASLNMLQAELRGSNGTTAAAAEARVQFRDGVIAGVVASNPDTLRLLAGLDLRPGQQQGGPPAAVTVVRLEPQDVPSFSRALGALDILAFNDFSSQELSAEQWGAIEAWVGQGGTLILGGGPGWRQTFAAVPESLLPVEVTGTKTLSNLQALADFAGEELPAQPVVVSDGHVRDGRIVVAEEGVPLVVTSRYGTGHIFYTAFDLGLDPVAFWRGNTPMWRQLLANTVSGNPWGGHRPGGQTDLQWVVRQFPHLDFPSTRNLAFMLIGYLAIVGPINYWVLKRLDKRDWAWVTIPVTVALVSAGIYGISFRGGGRDVLTNSIGILHLAPGVERVPADTVVGFYAPTRSRLSFEFGPRQHVFPLQQWDRWGWPGGIMSALNVDATVHQGAGTILSYGDHKNWTVRSFSVLQDIDVPGRMEGELRPTAAGEIAGTVVNNTPYDLTDVHVMLKNTFVVVGDLPAGGSREVTMQLQQPQQGYYHGDLIWQIYGPQPPDYRTTPEQQQRQSIIQNAFGQYANSTPYDVTVFGWMDEPLTDLKLGGKPSQHAQLTLVFGPMEFSLPQADFVLPPGLVTGEIYDSDMAGGWYNQGMLNMESGWAAFSVQLPALPAGVELTDLALTADRMGPNANNVSFELYNWQTGHWDEAVVAQNKIAVSDLDAYVYEGEVRLRVSVDQTGYVEVPFPSAIVTGKQVGN